MITFEDGPAKASTLMLLRTPIFLRVVESTEAKIDALDNPSDKPEPTEKIFAYIMSSCAGRVHLNRGRNGSGWYTMATYRMVAEQPSDETMRDHASWCDWVDSQPQSQANYREHLLDRSA